MALAPLKRLAESRRVAVVLVRHLVKSRSRSAILAGAGSVDVIGLARSGLLVAPDPTARDEFGRVLAQSKSNLAKAMAVRFRTTLAACGSVVVEWGDECDLRADDLLAQGAAAEDPTALDEAGFVLFTLLEKGPLPAKEVLKLARSAGVAEKTLRRAKKSLKVRSRRVGSGPSARWDWELPDDEKLLERFRELQLDELCERLFHGDPSTREDDGFDGRDSHDDREHRS